MNTLNLISGLLLRATSDTLRYILLTITISTLMFVDQLQSLNISGLFLIGLGIYMISYAFSTYAKNKSHGDSPLRFIIPVIALITSLIGVFYFLDTNSTTLQIISLLVYLMIWKRAMDSKIYDDDVKSVKTIMLVSMIFIVFMSLLIAVVPDIFNWYINVIKTYVPIFLIVTVLYMARINMANAYSKYQANTINKESNIKRFNIISTIIVLALLMFIFVDYSPFLTRLFNGFQSLLGYILYPIAIVGIKFSMFLKGIIGENPLYENQRAEELTEESRREIARVWAEVGPDKYGDLIVQIVDIMKWIVFAGIFVLIAYMLYKNFKELFYASQRQNNESEEKSFVKPSLNIRKGISNAFTNFRGIFSKQSYSQDGLHEIRRIYIQILKRLEVMGYTFKSYYTPNEFLHRLKNDKDYTHEGMDILTNYYNEVRYGNKQLEKDKIEKCKKIKHRISDS